MKKRMTTTIFAVAASLLPASAALAYPVDPAKVPVQLRPQDAVLAAGYTLAYDSINPNVIYYSPKTGRLAQLSDGYPLFGFAMFSGGAFFNAQFELGVFSSSRDNLFQAIANIGKTPVQFPYRRTKIVPLTSGFDPATNQETCTELPDPSTGGTIRFCPGTIYTQVVFSQQGPTLGENFAVSGSLNPDGAVVYNEAFRRGDVALMVNLESEYYAAGTAFQATVRVSYDKLFQNFQAYASFHGFFCTDIEVRTFFQNETTCINRRPEDCGVWIEYRNLVNGQPNGPAIVTGAIDPSDQAAQEQVKQAAERLAETLRDQMLTPISPQLGPINTTDRPVGFKLNASYEQQKRGLNATFTFTSPQGINVNKTTIPAAMACIHYPNGQLAKNTAGACAAYWR